MEKNQKARSKCNPWCEKLVKALTGHPSFKKFRSVPESKHVNPCVPTHKYKNSETKVSNKDDERMKDKKELVPSYSLQIHDDEEYNAKAMNMEKKKKLKKVEEKWIGSGGEKDINDVFSEYINRAKDKLSKGDDEEYDSNISAAASSGYKKKFNKDEHFTDYINRAKNKVRATSFSVGFSKGSKRG